MGVGGGQAQRGRGVSLSAGATGGVVRVELGERSYAAHVGHGLLGRLGELIAGAVGGVPRRVFMVVDDGLPGAVVSSARAGLASGGVGRVTVASMRATERDKSLATVEKLMGQIAATRHERGDVVVALGGGIVGDVAGLVAALYRRGCPVVQCPTTLLAMVDASVGGKTAVNLVLSGGAADAGGAGDEGGGGLLKNLVGAFHQPALVVADLEALAWLPDRAFAAGLAECAKHAMIGARWGDAGLLSWTEASASALVRREAGAVGELVARNIGVKARVVAEDEFERSPSSRGGRALLNLGHTFGHAIEPLAGVRLWGVGEGGERTWGEGGPILHGEAVALGCRAASGTARALGLIDAGLEARLVKLLSSLGLPTSATGLPGDDVLMSGMMHDKKVSGDVLRLVLPDGVGSARVVEGASAAAVSAGLSVLRHS